MSTHPTYRSDIDGLRAIAVLSVVAFHAFPKAMTGGFTGVDVFFVISGFLISSILYGSLERNQFSLLDFYGRRIRRIFPALILVLASCFAFGWFVLLPDEYAQLGKHMAGGAGFIQNWILWNESGYFDNAAETKPLLHLWSLGIEEQFYIIWPLILWAGYRQRFNLLAVTLLLALASFVLNIRGINVTKDLTATFYSPQTRFWELLIGAILAYLSLHSKSISKRWSIRGFTKLNAQTWANLCSILGFVLLMLGFVLINKQSQFPGWWALLPAIGSVLILSAGPHAWLNKTILSNRILVWFGLISYPLYLWHWALLSFARIVEGGIPSEWMRVGLVVLSIVLSTATYYLIEKPIRFGGHLKIKTAILILLMTVIGFMGYNTYKREGIGFRAVARVEGMYSYNPIVEREKIYAKWLRYICFLEEGQTFADYEKCQELESREHQNGQRKMIVWGDSHAASLMPGLKKVYGSQLNIYQRTTALCPPILGYVKNDRPNCTKINEDIMQFIESIKPDIVVLAAWWDAYDWRSIDKTVQRLKKIGIKNIYLVGPLPEWSDLLPNLIIRKMKSSRLNDAPAYSREGLKTDYRMLDEKLELYSKSESINFISSRRILCNSDGCLAMIGDTDKKFVSFDSAHLTEDGSIYLIKQINIQDH